MMDALTERLHESAEALSGVMPPPDQIRRRAERARRIRRAVAGSAAAALVVVLAVAVGVGGGRGVPDNLTTAVPARSSWSAPAGSVFTTDPLLSAAEWNDLLDHLPAERTERTTTQPHPLDCITDPYTLGAEQVQGAGYLQPARQQWATDALSSGRMNVYALWFGRATDATAAVKRLRQELVACRARPDPSLKVTYFHIEDFLMRDYPRIEQQFAGSIARQPGTGGRDPSYSAYNLTVARAGRLVIVFESLNGWADRPQNTIGLLMNHALKALSRRLAPSK